MQNHKKHDEISVDIINQENQVSKLSQGSVGKADKDPFCVYDHKRHAVGSKVISEDGSEMTCTEDGSWKRK